MQSVDLPMRWLLVMAANMLIITRVIGWPQNNSTSHSGYFQQLKQTLSRNIELDSAVNNISLFEVIRQEFDFQQLDCSQKGELYHLMGLSHYYLDQEYLAIDFFSKAAYQYWQECPQVSQEMRANTIYNIGICYQYTPEMHQAKKYLDQAINLFEKVPDASEVELALKYQGAGNYYLEMKDNLRAESYLRHAWTIFQDEEEFIVEQFATINQLLILSLDFQRYEEAIQYYELGLRLYNQHTEQFTSADLISLSLNIATAFLESEDFQTAMDICKKSLHTLNAESAHLEAHIYEVLGVIAMRLKHFGEAEKNYQKVYQLRRDDAVHQSPLGVAYALENLSDVNMARGEKNKAIEMINQALNHLCTGLRMDHHGNPVLVNSFLNHEIDVIRQLSIKEKMLAEIDSLSVASHQHRLQLHLKIDTVIQMALADLRFESSKLEVLSLVNGKYAEAIQYCISQFDRTGVDHFLQHAFYFSSRSKALLLQKQLEDARHFESLTDRQTLTREMEIRRGLASLQESLIHDQLNSDSLQREFVKKQLELELFNDQLERDHAELYASRYRFRNIMSSKAIQESIAEEDLVIDFSLSDGGYFSFWITKDKFFYCRHDTALINAHLPLLIDNCHDPEMPFSRDRSALIFDGLLREGLTKLKTIPIMRIRLIPDGLLHDLSFGVLVDRKTDDFLIKRFSLSSAFNVSLLFRQGFPRPLHTLAGFGTQYTDSLNDRLSNQIYAQPGINLHPLHMAEDEVFRASEGYNRRLYLGAEATLDHFLEESEQVDILYLSLHSLVDEQDGIRSCILFDDRSPDFILGYQDLIAHRTSADLVILSSCHTASGKLIKGEGVKGMTSSFIAAGSNHVISSLWAASEGSSLPILQHFLQTLKKRKKTDLALQESLVDYLAAAPPSLRHPYYWANYVLIGAAPAIQDEYQVKEYLICSIMLVAFIMLVFFFTNKRRLIL